MAYTEAGLPYVPVRLEQPFRTPGDAAVEVAQFVAMHGGQSRSRGLPTLETLWADFTILEPECIPFDIPNRNLNPRYAALEIASLLGGMPVESHQRLHAKGMAAYQDGFVQRGNYGVRIRNQLRDFVHKLVDDQGSRQAVMGIWEPRDLIDESSDVPCTLNVQGFLRDDMFYMRTTMRSNDVYLGLPYDLHQFCALQATMAEVFDVPCGFYRHSVGSLHCYLPDIDAVSDMVVPTDIPEAQDLWDMPDADPPERLAYVQLFCQEALFGAAMTPNTEFEAWLLEAI